MALLPLGISAASGAGGGGAGTDFQLISTQLLSGSAASVTFSSIPSTFRHIQLRSTAAGNASNNANLTMNGVTSGYAYHYLLGNGGSVSSSAITSAASIQLSGFNVAESPSFSGSIIDILDYSQTTKNKTVRAFIGVSSPFTNNVNLTSGSSFTTAAVTSLTIAAASGSLLTGSRFSLYGWN